MRYPAGHKQEKRKELLQASGALAKRAGFAASGVDALMQAAGATSGAFYSHFSSKSDLLKALIEHELGASREMWAGNPHRSAEEWLCFELDRYLSASHVRHPEAGCMLPPLAAEIARAETPVRVLYEKELRKGVAILARRLDSKELAWALLSQMVGAILLARAMPSEKGRREVLESSKRFLKEALLRLTAERSARPAPRRS